MGREDDMEWSLLLIGSLGWSIVGLEVLNIIFFYARRVENVGGGVVLLVFFFLLSLVIVGDCW